ncbi:hypothetical protein B0H14DRAFT_1309901 [Mycena olivaceomarginata]|nr:hypothetical protein B0H14DRAFT_1309901 [Mycena olivaceomarginata]
MSSPTFQYYRYSHSIPFRPPPPLVVYPTYFILPLTSSCFPHLTPPPFLITLLTLDPPTHKPISNPGTSNSTSMVIPAPHDHNERDLAAGMGRLSADGTSVSPDHYSVAYPQFTQLVRHMSNRQRKPGKVRPWPLHKDDTLFRSGRPTGLNIHASFCKDG